MRRWCGAQKKEIAHTSVIRTTPAIRSRQRFRLTASSLHDGLFCDEQETYLLHARPLLRGENRVPLSVCVLRLIVLAALRNQSFETPVIYNEALNVQRR